MNITSNPWGIDMRGLRNGIRSGNVAVGACHERVERFLNANSVVTEEIRHSIGHKTFSTQPSGRTSSICVNLQYMYMISCVRCPFHVYHDLCVLVAGQNGGGEGILIFPFASIHSLKMKLFTCMGTTYMYMYCACAILCIIYVSNTWCSGRKKSRVLSHILMWCPFILHHITIDIKSINTHFLCGVCKIL